MPTPPTNALRVIYAEAGWPRDGSAWGDAFARAFGSVPSESPVDSGPEPLKVLASGEVSVWACPLMVGGRWFDAVVKLQPMRSIVDRVRARMGWSRHHRQQRGAAALARAGIPCAPCVAVLVSPGWEMLVMEAVPGPTLLEWMMAPEPTRAETERVLDALAAYCKVMRASRLINGDNKPSNLVLCAHAGRLAISVVDTVEIGRATWGRSDEDWEIMLADLLKEPAGHGCLPRATLCLRAVYRIAPWLRGDRKALRAVWDGVASRVDRRSGHTPVDRLPRAERSRSAHVRLPGHSLD